MDSLESLNGKEENSKYCELCPCKLSIDIPSPMALERIHCMQADSAQNKKNKKNPVDLSIDKGCPWYINSSDHNYCFWTFAKTLNSPLSNREICQLLGINQIQLREDYNSAMEKLKSMQGETIMDEFLEIILDKIQSDRNMDIFHVNEDSGTTVDKLEAEEEDSLKKEDENELDIVLDILSTKKKRKGKNYSGQPMHRDGKKVDLWNLTSAKNRENNAKKNKPKK